MKTCDALKVINEDLQDVVEVLEEIEWATEPVDKALWDQAKERLDKVHMNKKKLLIATAPADMRLVV